MPTPAKVTLPPVTSWSYSRYADYKKCPAFFKYKHLEKRAEPPSPAMQRGTDIHKLAENYANGALKTLPQELKLFAEEFKHLKAQKQKIIEDSWVWTQGWAGETTWNDWKGAWVRIKLDAAYVNTDHNALVVIDHKTGKCRPQEHAAYGEQLELYALAGLLKFPTIDVVSPRLWYLDAGVIYPNGGDDQPELEYTREDEPKLKKVWKMRTDPMFKDKTYKPTPSENSCFFCPYKAEKGGPCKF